MTLATFQLLSLPTLLLAYLLMFWRAADRKELAATLLMLSLAGWVGEQTCIHWYAYYHYARGWWGFVGHVPILVPLIWPAVILSAMQVVRALSPELSRIRYGMAVGAFVIFDASLMEVVAVHAGFWSWAEGGHLGVPLVGMLGWGFFGGAVASFRAGAADQPTPATSALQSAAFRLMVTAVGALVFTHLMLNLAWWALFRWTLRDDLGSGSFAFVAIITFICGAFVWRWRPNKMSMATAIARSLAATVFFALLIANSQGPQFPGLQWLHVGLVAIPYLLATPRLKSGYRASRSG